MKFNKNFCLAFLALICILLVLGEVSSFKNNLKNFSQMDGDNKDSGSNDGLDDLDDLDLDGDLDAAMPSASRKSRKDSNTKKINTKAAINTNKNGEMRKNNVYKRIQVKGQISNEEKNDGKKEKSRKDNLGGVFGQKTPHVRSNSQLQKKRKQFRQEVEMDDSNIPDIIVGNEVISFQNAKKTFLSVSGYSSEQLVSQHIKEAEHEKVDFQNMYKYINNTVGFTPEDNQNFYENDLSEGILEKDDVITTASEKYMCALLKKDFGLSCADDPSEVIKGTEVHKNTDTEYFSKSWTEIWTKMFKDIERPQCKYNPNLEFKRITPINDSKLDSFSAKLPSVKPNVHYKYQGYEDSAYLFDYLDVLFQTRIVNAFTQFWELCNLLPPKVGIDDPYSLYSQTMMYYLSFGEKLGLKRPSKSDKIEDLISTMMKLKKDFSSEDYYLGISVPKLATIYQKFKWIYNPGDAGFFKRILDRYDFDGSGRLNLREFLFLTIWENRKEINSGRVFFPFYKLVKKYINPIFRFADCSNTGYVSADQLWSTFDNLKRTAEQGQNESYDMYSCEFPNGHRRTASVNDFVLKNNEVLEGALNIDEFAKGILLGYWDRQTTGNKIIKGDEKNQKETRWEDKKIDKECENIKKFAQLAHN